MKMVEAISRTMMRTVSVPEVLGPVTLNLPQRKEKLREINQSNLKLLTRLESAKSEYSIKGMNDRNMQNQKYLLNSSYSLRKKCEKIATEVNRQSHK
jgi:hypothetical protein